MSGLLVVIVASQNPVKIAAVRAGFERMLRDTTATVDGVAISSGVADQPRSDAETFQGAWNRALRASEARPRADFWVGIEGGVEERSGAMESFAWIVVRSRGGTCGRGRTSTFFLPSAVASLIRQGKELGEADDIVFKRSNSKQENGAVGLLTRDVIDRTHYYTDAVILALIPFVNKQLYS